MSGQTGTTVTYQMHGVGVSVVADDPAVHDAMELRLCAFPTSVRTSVPGIRLEFVNAVAANELPTERDPESASRAVYETPYGSVHYDPDTDLLAGELGGVSLACSAADGQAHISAPGFGGRLLYFATHPVATVALMELMERRQRFSLHAACLADSRGTGLLVCGPSGAGKSTLTLALARTELGFLADDTVFLERGAGEVYALGFPDALGVGEFAARRFPELTQACRHEAPGGFPKRLHRYEALFGRAPLMACIPRVIVFPEVAADAPSAVEPLDAGDALVRLAPDVLLTEERATRAHIDAIGALLKQTRCYTLRSGRDIHNAASLVRALLD